MMGTGYIRVQVSAGGEALPIADAEVTIKKEGKSLFKTLTDKNGKTENFALPAPCFQNTLYPYSDRLTYSLCDIEVRAAGFVTQYIKNIEILSTQTAILPVYMEPLADKRHPERNTTIDIPPNAQTHINPCPIKEASPARSRNEVIIPEFITVHLGRPENPAARNVRVPFVDYIKNVASSEIYATWPEQSLRANIHAIVSFALNRIYTEWYPSRNYPFDITNSTAYDQYYRYGGPVYESISVLVDEIFNVYAHRIGFRNPYLVV
ncbi:MAG: SpoIID/LytB domain-containing protein [Oscillospiraceae bacterium]|jgi:hypothetical protein|nr:SpoIID/LytB domain-containing protein [Oscillospiraceae bacterium]